MRNTQSTNLLSELSRPGRRGARVGALDVPAVDVVAAIPAHARADAPPALPELSELDIVRHYTNLSTLNMSVDSHFYPLGSCTMKYNPKRNERLAALPGMLDVHPYQPESSLQGMLEMLWNLQGIFAEIAGLDAVSLQPAAGAQGELTALLVAAAYFRDRGEVRSNVLVPTSAHGTNPASAVMAGFKAIGIESDAEGMVDMVDLRSKIDAQTAVLMITNPNTLGLFERNIVEIARLVHEAGGLIYLDGANMNAILGAARPGDFGADMMHYNPHKTFSGPHGGGGPGAGPIAVRAMLEPFLPTPRVVRHEGGFSLDFNHPKSIGRVRSFFGNVGVLLRAYAYIRTLGADGLADVSRYAVLNANYLLALLRDLLPVPYSKGCLHEFVGSAMEMKSRSGISAMDLAKRLLDYGFHAPTVYFPITVREAVMIEPTETESRETLDAFADAIRTIIGEPTELVQAAPHTAAVNRPDEVQAAKSQRLAWSAAP
ncbi:MAG: aminomethyl-transferring glycine dehydrogenase subunit GcvPB [Planctomycetia bacterium]|nr:aminomethyl-transferring glycine dehydrogenase subunit GcvPB [Planctomycetia bacterium]RLT13923.1 MAG: glycine dehydrogenase subunit 2 [Planctomycetota bacterium]